MSNRNTEQPFCQADVMRCFIVKLYNDNNELLETVEVMAKGKKTAWRSAKFKTPIRWGYWMDATSK
jgi:hypothetical protein